MVQCSQDVLKRVEGADQLTASESEQGQSVEVAKSSAHETVSSVPSCTAVDARYVQLRGDKAAVC